MNPYLTSQDEVKLIKPVIIKYNHIEVKCAIRHIWSVKDKHNVRHMVRLIGKGLKLAADAAAFAPCCRSGICCTIGRAGYQHQVQTRR